MYDELKAVCDMVCGGIGSPPVYDPKRLWQVADYEVDVNGRFPELQSYVSGEYYPLCTDCTLVLASKPLYFVCHLLLCIAQHVGNH